MGQCNHGDKIHWTIATGNEESKGISLDREDLTDLHGEFILDNVFDLTGEEVESGTAEMGQLEGERWCSS